MHYKISDKMCNDLLARRSATGVFITVSLMSSGLSGVVGTFI
jgi:hypothetical protein